MKVYWKVMRRYRKESPEGNPTMSISYVKIEGNKPEDTVRTTPHFIIKEDFFYNYESAKAFFKIFE